MGFFSGFKPVGEILPNPPTFSITINDTNPVFYYCSAPGSCINHGMVGVINPNGTTSIDTQIALAKNSSFMLQPGQAWPSEEEDPFPSSSSSATVAATSTKPSATKTPTSTAPASTTTAAAVSSNSHGGLSGGAIAGIAIGAAAIALIAAVLLYMCGRQSRKRYSSAHQTPPNMSNQHATPSIYLPGSQHMSFVPSPHNKHASAMSSTTSPLMRYGSPPPLPGYIPQHDPAMSPPLSHSFPAPIDNSVHHSGGENMSEAGGVPSSPSPSNQGFVPPVSGAAPAYNQLQHQHQHPAMM